MSKKPFFAKFLENQFSKEETKNLKGGDLVVTLKFPSDQADTGGNPGYDGCNNPGNSALNNPNCGPMTLKFPSEEA